MTVRAAVLMCLAVAMGALAAPIATLKTLYPRTEITVGGDAKALVVTPVGGETTAPVQALVDGIKAASGVQLQTVAADTLVSASWEIDQGAIAGRTLIALGNINNNRLLAVLWGEGYVAADSIWPGEGGHVIRTVHDPFALGSNVLVLAGSDDAGVAKAVEVFQREYLPKTRGDTVLPEPVVDIEFARTEMRFFPPPTHYLSSKRQPQYSTIEYFRKLFAGSKLMDADGNVVRRDGGNLTTVTGAIARLAQTYFRTGDPALPRLMKQILDRNRHLLANVPRRVEMEGSSATHLRWWDTVEELPVWTDQDRLDITNAILSDSLQGHEKRAAHEMVKDGFTQVVDENHGTNSALNTFRAWQYFEKYYDVPETDYWMSVARATLAGQSASHQILEDAAGYLCYCPIHAMHYAFADRDLRFLGLGIARGHAEYIAQCAINNLGLSTGFGDSPSLVLPAVFEALAPVAWHLKDPRLAWVVRTKLPQACGLRIFQSDIPFDLSVEPEEPVDWTGMALFPIFKQTLRKGEGSKGFISDPREPVGSEWFNKVVFREAWDPDAQYLILDGAGKFGTREGYPNGPAGHRHEDVNTIVNFTDEGRMWLVDHTYGSRTIKDHSGLYITRNGQVGYRGHEAKLQDFVPGEKASLCRTVYEGFSGADWERTIFWQPGDHFVVLDRAIAREPGEYVVRCSYRGLGDAEQRESGIRLTQAGKYCDIIGDGGGNLDVEDFAFPNPDEWKRWYEFAPPIAKVFQQQKSGMLQSGDAISFANLIRAGSIGDPAEPAQLDAVSATAVLAKTPGGTALYGTGTPPGDWTDAQVYAIGREWAVLSGLTRLGTPGAVLLKASAPVSLDLNAGADAVLDSAGPVTVTLQGQDAPLQLAAGQHTVESPALRDGLREMPAQCLSSAHELAATYDPRGEEDGKALEFGLGTDSVALGREVSKLLVADLDGDVAAEWVTVGPAGAAALKPGGTVLWSFPTEEPCRALGVGDVDGDGKRELVVGCDDHRAYLLGADGKERWRFECKPSESNSLPPAVDFVRIVDLEGDGEPEVVVGANWVHCLKADGTLKWEKYLRFSRGRVVGDFKVGAIADLDKDQRLDILALFLYSYHQALAFDADGNIILPPDHDNDRRFGVNIDLPQDVLVTRLWPDVDEVQFVTAGDKYLHTYWASGQHAGTSGGRKAGCYVALASYEPFGERPFVYGATDMGAVVAYRAADRRNDEWITLDVPWTHGTGEKPSALWAGDIDGDGKGDVLVGTKSGTVERLDAETGEVLGRRRGASSPVVQFARFGGGLLAVHADGTVASLETAQ